MTKRCTYIYKPFLKNECFPAANANALFSRTKLKTDAQLMLNLTIKNSLNGFLERVFIFLRCFCPQTETIHICKITLFIFNNHFLYYFLSLGEKSQGFQLFFQLGATRHSKISLQMKSYMVFSAQNRKKNN